VKILGGVYVPKHEGWRVVCPGLCCSSRGAGGKRVVQHSWQDRLSRPWDLSRNEHCRLFCVAVLCRLQQCATPQHSKSHSASG